MKIGILTQPLKNNYGGLLQNYALQTVLKRMGHEVITIDRKRYISLKDKFIIIFKRVVLRCLLNRKDIYPIIPYWINKRDFRTISKNTNSFIKENIYVTEEITSNRGMKRLNKYNLDAYIVGSDQVWRPLYSPNLPTYFLDFLENNNRLKKISYAASLGTDKWELSRKETKMAIKLIKQFDAVSVREESAISLIRDYLGLDAVHVLDPTMLLTALDYKELIKTHNTKHSQGDLFVYILDETIEIQPIVNRISNDKNLTPFRIMPDEMPSSEIDKCIFPPVYQWIRSFIDAEFVITDSFHGTVFSIIFGKPFVVIPNKSRGNSRFISLLNILGLNSLMVNTVEEITNEIYEPIDYESIRSVLVEWRTKSISFINDNL